MRAMDTYNKEKDRKLVFMVDTCMRSLWLCYFVINLGWFALVLLHGDYRRGLLLQTLVPMLLTGVFYLIYFFALVLTERPVWQPVFYLILNVFMILLLLHPSRLPVLDGLYLGVIAMFPVWTNQLWTKIQMFVSALVIIARHVVLYMTHVRLAGYWQSVSVLGMFCIGVMLYYNVRYVHDQTLLLGDATRMDAATGLYNHEYFYEELEKRMKAFAAVPEEERAGACFSLLIADIDNFKRVNDTYGHAFGDEVLAGLADIFKDYCGEKDFAARYGGEEFVLIVGGCHKKDALTRANTIRKKFQDTVFAEGGGAEHQFTVSLGVAEYDRPWDTASLFFDQADQALYQAKNTGKNRVCIA